MFLLVFGRHVGAHVHRHQHGVSIQISINLGKTFLRISSMRKNLGKSLCICTFFLFPDSGLDLLNGFDFLFWSILNGVTLKTSNRNTENMFSISFRKYRDEEKEKQLIYFDLRNVNSLCSRHH